MLGAYYKARPDPLRLLHSRGCAIGSTARFREQVTRLVAEGGINYVIGAFAWGSLTHAQSRHSLDLFVREVMPAVR